MKFTNQYTSFIAFSGLYLRRQKTLSSDQNMQVFPIFLRPSKRSSDPRKDKQSSVSKGTPRGNDDDKQWLSQEGEQFDKALQFIREGGSVAEIRQKYKVSKKVATSLEEQGIIPF